MLLRRVAKDMASSLLSWHTRYDLNAANFRRYNQWKCALQTKEKYRGVFEIQKSGGKTSSGEIGLDIRTHASPKVGQDQVSEGVSVPCRHATPVANALRKPIFSNNVKVGKKSNQGKVS